MSFDRNSLLFFLEGTKERVGVVLKSLNPVELENVCRDPEEGFEVDASELLAFFDDVVATWHTHPGASCNLSVGDHQCFLNYPELRHYIVGTDGVAEYYVEDGKVLRVDDEAESDLPREAQGDLPGAG